MSVIYILIVVQERHGEDMKIDTTVLSSEQLAIEQLYAEFALQKSLAPDKSIAIIHGRHFTVRNAQPHLFVRGIVQGKVVP